MSYSPPPHGGNLIQRFIQVAKTPAPSFERDLGKLEGSVNILTKMTFAVISILTVIVAGGIALLIQMSTLKSDLENAKNDISSRLDKIETAIANMTSGQSSVSGALSRIENRLAELSRPAPQPQLLALSNEDRSMIREQLKFDPDVVYKGIGKLGEVVTNAKLLDFPDELIQKIPALKGTRYTFDIKAEILILSMPEQRIVAIV
jgi:hypothetical protein